MAAWYALADLVPVPPRRRDRARPGGARPQERPGAARPAADPPSLARQGLGPHACPIRSASPRASTRMPKCPTPCSVSASASSRSAASRRGRRPAIRGRACSACREDRGVINRMGFNSDGLDAVRVAAARRARGAASSASMSAPTRTAPIAPPTTSPAAAALAPLRRLPRVQRLLAQHAGPARPAGSRRSSPTC